MGIEEGPFLPFCTKWKDLGKKHKLKHRSADWESLRGGLEGVRINIRHMCQTCSTYLLHSSLTPKAS